MMAKLVFVNIDATPKTVSLNVGKKSVEPIMAWYGAYFAGDRYTVFVDGEKVRKDQNGELIGNL